MADATPYGGQAWIQQQIQAAVQAAMQQINWSQLMGYGYPQMYEPQAPTRNDMLNAIWENRPDIQAFYRENWGDPTEAEGDLWNWRPEDAMENWLGMTGELTPEQKADPMAWAIEQGHIVDYTAEGAVPTLERDRFEQAKQEWSDTQLRLLGLDEEAIRQFNETMGLYREQFSEDVREADRQYARLLGLDDDAMERWEREQDRIEAWDAEAIREANRQFLFQEGVALEDIRQFNAAHDLAVWQGQQDQANIEWEQLHLTGLSDQAAYEFQQTHGLAEREFEAGSDQWWAAFGLEQEQFNVQTGQWDKKFGLEQQYFGLSEEELELKRLELLLSQSGPQDWPQYWALSRGMPEVSGAYGEPIPAWQQMLQSGQAFPAFGVPGAPSPQYPLGGLDSAPMQGEPFPTREEYASRYVTPLWGQGATFEEHMAGYDRMLAEGYTPGMVGLLSQQAGRATGFIPPNIGGYEIPSTIPWQVSPEQWYGMGPSEIQGLAGQVQTGGGWMPDWMKGMQAGWPTGQATPISYFGG